MSIRIRKPDLAQVLDRALRDAREGGSPLWRQRVEWLSDRARDSQGKTYVAALGAALLAKATDARVDALSNTANAGPRGYSMRGVAEYLQEQVRGRVHLGTLSKWPVNNSPFNRGPARIDRFTAIAGHTRPIYDEFARWLDELDGYDADQAYEALVAFLGVRAQVQRDADVAVHSGARMDAARSLEDLVDALQVFVSEDPEGGGRGQAIVAAVLDCAFDDVEVVPKNHPAPFDVKRAGSPPPLVVEVKQQSITAADVLELARRAAEADADRAVYAALDPAQPSLAIDRIRADALRDHGVAIDVVVDLRELVGRLAVYGMAAPSTTIGDLPSLAVARCRAAEISAAGQDRLAALLRGASDG